jgi:hypothetical protein
LKHAPTDERLLERLRQAAARSPTAADLRRQRASYVFGNLADDDPMTKAEVAAILAALDGEAR